MDSRRIPCEFKNHRAFSMPKVMTCANVSFMRDSGSALALTVTFCILFTDYLTYIRRFTACTGM